MMNVDPLAMPDSLAHEFYDTALHPTTANFRELSLALMRNWCQNAVIPDMFIEIGSGRSVALDVNEFADIDGVCIDHSREMLKYSRNGHLLLLVADAARLPLRTKSVSLVLVSLGAPFNVAEFWSEAHRILGRGGEVWFTAPSFAWSSMFRAGTAGLAHERATFAVQGAKVELPSLTYTRDRQAAMIHSSGLVVAEVCDAPLSWLEMDRRSPSLGGLSENTAVITGYRCRRTA